MVDELLDTAPCGFVSLSDDGTVLLANTTLAVWLDMPVDELRGRRFESLLSVGGRVFYQTHVFPLLKLSGRSEELYLTLRNSKGYDLPVLVNGVQRQAPGGVEYSLVLVPMHQRDRYEEELVLARRSAEEANVQLADANLRLQTLDRLKDELLAHTSHDIGSLVTIIRASCQMLIREKRASTVDPMRYIRSISDATDRLLVLLRDLSDLALVNTGELRLEPRSLLLSAVAQGAVDELAGRADGKSITVSLERPEDEPHVQADYHRLYQVVSNLLGNAIKFTPAGGRITVKVQRQGDRVSLSVQDTGIGLPAERVSELFTRFRNVSTHGNRGRAGQRIGIGHCTTIG